MSQRTQKVASLVHHLVAAELMRELASPELTVTGVDVAPDLRHATVWLGVAADPESTQALINRAQAIRPQLQQAVSGGLSTKFVPRLELKHDTTGQHADHIQRLINDSKPK